MLTTVINFPVCGLFLYICAVKRTRDELEERAKSMIYLNVMVTLVFAMILVWFVYESFIRWRLNKPNLNKALAEQYKVAEDYFSLSHQIQTSFKKGDFTDVLSCAEKIFKEMPYDSSAIMYKGYALYHLKRYPEAKEMLALLETMPSTDTAKIMENIIASEK
jgi:tetratricopeptide (TPR) repeat protein